MGISKKPTLQDIAELAGVTKMTVSKALRNQEGVSENVQSKILKIAKELDYDFTTPKYLRNSRTNNIAVLVPEVFMETEEIFYTSIFKYLCSEAVKKKILPYPLCRYERGRRASCLSSTMQARQS